VVAPRIRDGAGRPHLDWPASVPGGCLVDLRDSFLEFERSFLLLLYIYIYILVAGYIGDASPCF
jgi:hypothetical protein